VLFHRRLHEGKSLRPIPVHVDREDTAFVLGGMSPENLHKPRMATPYPCNHPVAPSEKLAQSVEA
jgi:hypothetical protein